MTATPTRGYRPASVATTLGVATVAGGELRRGVPAGCQSVL